MRIIAGEARGRTIDTPKGLNTRPTLDRVRENLFNMIQSDVAGSRVLDLFAGSGALSLEALSRGAAYAVMNAHDRNACAVQKKNIETLRYEEKVRQYRCEWQEALRQLAAAKERFDLVFLDPPYAMKGIQDVFFGLEKVTEPESLIVLEHEAGKSVKAPEHYIQVKERLWGYCGVTIYRRDTEGD